MSSPILTINPSKQSTIEFNVAIDGIETLPTVRFVIHHKDGYACSFPCTAIEGDSTIWSVKIPKLPMFTTGNTKFSVEVIVEGYYFEPAEGTISLVSAPDVKFDTKTKPKVTTSFTVKQVDEADALGQVAPTTALNLPEFPPEETHAEPSESEIVSTEVPYSDVIPGDTALEQPATPTVHSGISKLTKPPTSGSLFKRDASGKPIVSGLDTPSSRARKVANTLAVRELLSQKD